MNNSALKLAAMSAVLAFGTFAEAQQLKYVASGTLNPASLTYGGFYITGPITGSSQEYASGYSGLSAAVDAVLARPIAVSQNTLAPLTNITAQFGYNASTPAIRTSTNEVRSSSTYAIDDIAATLSGPGVSAVNLLATNATMTVITRATRTSLSFSSAIPSAGIGYSDAAPGIELVDLAAVIRSDPDNTFDLTGISSLPVRLTSPQSFEQTFFYGFAIGTRSNVAPFTSPLPSALQLADYNSAFGFGADYEGQYVVSVNPADYASLPDYEAASAWVSSHVQQITYYHTLDYTIDVLQAASVPEPANYLLLTGGMLALWSAARRRNARSHGE